MGIFIYSSFYFVYHIILSKWSGVRLEGVTAVQTESPPSFLLFPLFLPLGGMWR
jgi:hypothetical protein